MFSIGEFARHGRVSVRMLRHYDAIGLLRPASVDADSGYRFYQASQLAELNRIIALKDLGFMMRQLEIDNGVPVAAPVDGDGDIIAGVLPAGRYATVMHVGHPSELIEATKALLDWGAEQGLTWDMSPSADGDRWGSRLEIYLTDPREEPDMSKWVTQLAFRLAD
jgi:effector-binding domain-containing protein